MSDTIFSDLDVSFGLDASGDIQLVTDNASVSQSITNILNTVKGFRPGNPNKNYGVGIRGFLFAPMDNFVAEMLGEELLTQLERYEPRIDISGLEVTKDEEHKAYDISIFYNIKNVDTTSTQVYKLVLKTL